MHLGEVAQEVCWFRALLRIDEQRLGSELVISRLVLVQVLVEVRRHLVVLGLYLAVGAHDLVAQFPEHAAGHNEPVRRLAQQVEFDEEERGAKEIAVPHLGKLTDDYIAASRGAIEILGILHVAPAILERSLGIDDVE